MTHLEFAEKLQKFGITIKSTNTENDIKEIIVPGWFGQQSNVLLIENSKLRWEYKDDRDPITELIKIGIDMGSWKHSWHNDIKPENYEKFQDIIQKRILDRAEEIDILLSTYFQLSFETIKNNVKTNDL